MTTSHNLTIGNTATPVDNRWNWRFFIEAGDAAHDIDKVVVELHPTFKQRLYTLSMDDRGKFVSPRFTGWGTFDIGVMVYWKDSDASSTLTHHLSFEDGGTRYQVQVEAPSRASQSRDINIDAPEEPEEEVSREDIETLLEGTPFLEPTEPAFFHGRGFTGPDVAPRKTWASSDKPRNDHDAPNWLTASEFTDVPKVAASKVQHLARLLKLSKKTVVYSGAGISRGAGIGQAARGSGGSGGKSTDAMPTFTHYALGALARAGYIHGWVQQNHDGLPQKAGFPQENINEIHGSWYDPSNPVVKYSGTLKDEQYPWMQDDANTADLVLVLGTSLGGLNADQVATKPAARSLRGRALGTVMINLQQTEQDGKATLRIFGKSDNVLGDLLASMGISDIPLQPATFKQESRVLVPYDRHGNRSETAKMWLDLREGAHVKLTDGHNIQGAQQPAYMHIGADKPYKGRKNGPGHGTVWRRNDAVVGIELKIEGVRMLLGQWWLEAAQRGGPQTLPVVNLEPEIVCE